MHESDETGTPDPAPSKSRLKREAQALTRLGVQLAELPRENWLELSLPEELVNALDKIRQIRSHGALKRQQQYIGKLMRHIDTAPIEAFFMQRSLENRRRIDKHHQMEAWRDRLIEEGDPALDAYLEQYPDVDRRRLRQLIRQARKEASQGKAPKASRTLFRYLRDL